MKAVLATKPGGPEVLQIAEVPDPVPSAEQLLIHVRATALNRADLLQRLGRYPPSPGESDILGLELAGDVVAMGSAVEGFQIGDRIFALVSGGAYAQKAVVDYRMAIPIPEGMSYTEAAAIPEAFFTAHEVLFTCGRLTTGETVLIHAAGSGVGTAAVQMAAHCGAHILATARTTEKLNLARSLGAQDTYCCSDGLFAEWIRHRTEDRGVHLIVDPVGAAYWEANLNSLATQGRLVVFGLLGGRSTAVDLSMILTKRLSIIGTVLRSRSLAEKISLTQEFKARWLPLLARKVLRPVIDSVFPWDRVADAHRYMEANRNLGKIVLVIDDSSQRCEASHSDPT
ncbi:MAG: NAD(P)H-quinone oxidoreductase [Nitrospirae bacterium]|nr:MAG: NAD(P)H-quinone oxidoreductase [Nitrospirota bacterium]